VRPEEDHARVDERDQQNLDQHRVPQAHGRLVGRHELRAVRLRHQIALEEAMHQRPHALMHHELGDDQQRQGHQQPHVDLDVLEEGHLDGRAPRPPGQDRQHEQGEPGEGHGHDDAPAQELERIAHQVGPPGELEERPAQHQREIVRIRRHREVASRHRDVTSKAW
jgi:hypothetical protein